MARKTTVELVDDLDGTSPADKTIRFGVDGGDYEIELSAEHADDFYTDLGPYLAVARKAGRRSAAAKPRRAPQRQSEATAIRAWAREQGYQVSDRGRVASQVQAAYDAAHQKRYCQQVHPGAATTPAADSVADHVAALVDGWTDRDNERRHRRNRVG